MRYPFIFYFIFIFFSANLCAQNTISSSIIPFPDYISEAKEFSSIQTIILDENFDLKVYEPWLSTDNLPFKISPNTPNTFITINENLPIRSYEIDILSNKINIQINSKEDIRNALITLLQLYQLNEGKLPVVQIKDHAEFDYRGMHLDVCRHYFPVSDIKKYIDFLCFYKFNRFHWHLTDDQGWRIEIKKYPKLQEIAAYRNETLVGHYNDQPHQFDKTKHGGFYTHEDVKKIVAYAKSRGIEVIPEIEMPGHAQAAIAAYPELSCSTNHTEPIQVATKWGVFSEVFCPTETTFEFLQHVLDEVITLFPSKYIHIGGDECPKEAWKNSAFCQLLMQTEKLDDEAQLQNYFINRIAKYLNQKGKTVIGWDEIMEGGNLDKNAIVMSWRGEKGGIEAANEGHKVVMTPGSHCYFDHYQSTNNDEPVAIGGLTTVEKVYHYNIVPSEIKDKQELIWGAQGNLWTEYISDFDHLTYMALARMIALSEALFNPLDSRNYQLFQERFAVHIDYWKTKGYNVADHQLDLKTKVITKPNEGSFLVIQNKPPKSSIQIKTPNDTKFSPVSYDTIELKTPGNYELFATNESKSGRSTSFDFTKTQANRAIISLSNPASEAYPGSGSDAVINGIIGNHEKYGGNEWLGFYGKDFEANLTFESPININKITLHFFKGEGQWIYLPSNIEIYTSTTGTDFTMLTKESQIETQSKVCTIELAINCSTKHLKIVAKNHGIIAQGMQGAGHPSWLFVDEIIIH